MRCTYRFAAGEKRYSYFITKEGQRYFYRKKIQLIPTFHINSSTTKNFCKFPKQEYDAMPINAYFIKLIYCHTHNFFIKKNIIVLNEARAINYVWIYTLVPYTIFYHKLLCFSPSAKWISTQIKWFRTVEEFSINTWIKD